MDVRSSGLLAADSSVMEGEPVRKRPVFQRQRAWSIQKWVEPMKDTRRRSRTRSFDRKRGGGEPVAGHTIVRVDRRYFRPAEVDTLLGDPAKARGRLGRAPEVSFPQLVAEMMRED